MIIKLLAATISIFLLLACESFTSVLFSFSVVVVISLILVDKLNWKVWFLFVSVLSIFTDIVLHHTLGTTLLTVSISAILLFLFFSIFPKKDSIFSYFPYLLVTIIFYLLIQLLSPLFADGIWGRIEWIDLIGIGIKSLVSTILIFIVDMGIDKFWTGKQSLMR